MKRILLLVLSSALVLSACNKIAEPNWVRLDDIAYVIPTDLPDGYALAYATERPGRPFKEWDTHAELYTNSAQEFIAVVATRSTKADAPARPGPPTEDGPFDPAYLIAYVHGGYEGPEDHYKTLQTYWGNKTLTWSVMHVAASPDAALVSRIAKKFERNDDLGFRAPHSVGSGFTNAGALGSDVTDYSMVFSPKQYIGENREAAIDKPDDSPSISVNVGAHFYAQRPDLKPLDKAVFDDSEKYVRLEFVWRGNVVTVGSATATRKQMLAVAESLKKYSYRDWQLQWGDRLLTQDVPGA